ncbi:MAG: hypothetical protein C0606_05260 [Hyphomicrobiales bacterium]|nr:MAG: hypothetical protein C0606_05260 [Hyphomicrobiales bacterium]
MSICRPVIVFLALFTGLAALMLAPYAAVDGRAQTLMQTIDPHALYEARCVRCHPPHAGEFVPSALERDEDGTIVGKHRGAAIDDLLVNGHGRLSKEEVPVMLDHLTRIFELGSLFRNRCLICHDRAVDLARERLALKDGRVIGRYSGRDIATFLQSHGRLSLEEIAPVIDMLTRQIATAQRGL